MFVRLGKPGSSILTVPVFALLLGAAGCHTSYSETTVVTNLAGRAERSFTIPLDIRSGDTIVLDCEFGDLEVRATRGETRATCQARIAGRNNEEAARALAGYRLTARRTGSRVTIGLEGAPLVMRDESFNGQTTASGPMLIAVPTSTAVDGRTAHGDVRLMGTLGDLTARTKFGDITIEGASGRIDAETDSGAIRVETPRSDRTRLVTSFGDVHAEGPFRVLDIETSSGDIDVIARPRSRAAEPWRIETKFGDVKLALPRGFDCTLRMETRFGDIRTDYDGGDARIEGMSNRLDIALGTGNPVIDVKTSSGDIDVR